MAIPVWFWLFVPATVEVIAPAAFALPPTVPPEIVLVVDVTSPSTLVSEAAFLVHRSPWICAVLLMVADPFATNTEPRTLELLSCV